MRLVGAWREDGSVPAVGRLAEGQKWKCVLSGSLSRAQIVDFRLSSFIQELFYSGLELVFTLVCFAGASRFACVLFWRGNYGMHPLFSLILRALILAMLTLAELKLRLLLQLGESRLEPGCRRTCGLTCLLTHSSRTSSQPAVSHQGVCESLECV